LQRLDAKAVWAPRSTTNVCAFDIKSFHLNVAGPYRMLGNEQHLADRAFAFDALLEAAAQAKPSAPEKDTSMRPA
jgi:hypothetical protein